MVAAVQFVHGVVWAFAVIVRALSQFIEADTAVLVTKILICYLQPGFQRNFFYHSNYKKKFLGAITFKGKGSALLVQAPKTAE